MPAARARQQSASPPSRVRTRLLAGVALCGDQVERGGVAAGTPVGPAIEAVDLVQLVVREVEVEQLEVLAHALDAVRLREDDRPTLEVPAQNHLRNRLANVLGDRGQRWVVED